MQQFEAERETEARHRLTTDLLHELVVAPATTDGVLSAHALFYLDFEDGSRVVIETTHERGVFNIADPCIIEIRFHLCIVRLAFFSKAHP